VAIIEGDHGRSWEIIGDHGRSPARRRVAIIEREIMGDQ
jgi:hypothetical protein